MNPDDFDPLNDSDPDSDLYRGPSDYPNPSTETDPMNAIASNIRTPPTLLEYAAERLLQAKAAEQQAQQQRLVAELEVLDLLGEIDGEGTTRREAGNYKLTVRCAMNRSVDRDVLCQIANDIPEAIGKRLFRWKPELVLSELRHLQSNEIELYGVIAQAITMKSAKPSISVERSEG